jgi:DNA polymerase III epsilon subunit-like protein
MHHVRHGLPSFGSSKRKRGDPFPAPEKFDEYDSSRIVSICWLIVDKATQQILQQEYYVVSPSNFTIPTEVIAIHGITNEYAAAYGHPINFVLERMREALTRVDTVIAYNIDFDFNITKSEMMRQNMDVSDYDTKIRICCMKMVKEHLNLKYNTRLVKAYKSIVGRDMLDAHNAVCDTLGCHEIYKKILKKIAFRSTSRES